MYFFGFEMDDKTKRNIEESMRLAGMARILIDDGEAKIRQAKVYFKKIERNLKAITGEDCEKISGKSRSDLES